MNPNLPRMFCLGILVTALGVAHLSAAELATSGDVAHRLKVIDAAGNAGPFKPEWDSLRNFKVPEWYLDAKFGIFIHWGVYSVPAFGSEWYPRKMYVAGTNEFKHHVATYGSQAKFGYKDFIPLFKAEKFDAGAWAQLFKEAGAKFIVPVAEHHDGFSMYDNGLSEWNAVKMGPKRDIIGELAKAARAQGLIFGLSSHRAEHWWFYNGGRTFDSDVQDPRFDGLYGPARPGNEKEQHPEQPNQAFLDDWLARSCELVDKYRPQLVWFDWWIEQPAFEPYRQKFAAFYYNRGAQWGRGVALNYKKKAFPPETAVLDIERGQLAGIRPFFWQTDTSVAKNSWGYTTDLQYKTSASLIGDLIDIVSKNGALLLNIGPRSDGTISYPDQEILRDIGRWLSVYGEAIYGTRPWKVYGEGPTQVVEGSFGDDRRQAFTSEDIRFTAKGDSLYAIALAWPSDGRLLIRTLAGRKIADLQLLGHDGALKYEPGESGLTVWLPAGVPIAPALALKISLRH